MTMFSFEVQQTLTRGRRVNNDEEESCRSPECIRLFFSMKQVLGNCKRPTLNGCNSVSADQL